MLFIGRFGSAERLGVAQEGSETSSMGTPWATLGLPWCTGGARQDEDFLFRLSTTGGAERLYSMEDRDPAWTDAVGHLSRQALLALLRGLGGRVQAKDAGWPHFNGKYTACPHFRKERLAHMRIYHAQKRRVGMLHDERDMPGPWYEIHGILWTHALINQKNTEYLSIPPSESFTHFETCSTGSLRGNLLR